METTTINAQRTDKKTVINILCQSFAHDPQINWIVGEGNNKANRMKRLMAYAFEHGMVNGRVQLTEDKKAVTIWKNHHSKKMNWYLLLENIKFLFSFGFKRLARITKMEIKIAENYPKNKHFDYLWFIGTLPNEQGKGHGSALINPILKKCKEEQKEVYLETTTDVNLNYYQKKGFELYDSLKVGINNQMLVYLLKTSNSI